MSAVLAPSDQLVSLVYVSSASRPLSDEEIADILRVARTNNERLGITGMLLYKDGNFLQVLEGPADALDQVLAKIKKDPRHRGLIPMSRKPIQEREFPEWSMAYRNMHKSAPNEDGLSPFLEPDFEDDSFSEKNSLTYRLLQRFKRDMR